MRRFILIFVIIIVILILMRVVNSGKYVSNKTPLQQSKILYEDAMKLKSTDSEKAIELFESIVTGFPQTTDAQKSLLAIVEIYKNANELSLTKQTLKRFFELYPQEELTAVAREKLGEVNIKILFSPTPTDTSFLYEVQVGDSLYKIAKKYKTTVDLLMKSNNLTKSLIKPGMKLKVEKAVFAIKISKSEGKLILKANDEIVKKYPVGLGENNSTPVGQFKITTRIIDPVWYKTGAIVPANSPENILGTRWLGLSEPGYGIHGTVDPQPINKQRTQGCVRMRNKDVEELFIIVPRGTEVVIDD